MAAGDIGLTNISGDVGELIRVGQFLNGNGFSEFEHAFVDLGDGTIVEAMPGGAQHVKNWHPVERTAYLICPPQYGASVAAAALKYVKVPYSAADYFALAAHRLHIPAPGLKGYIERDRSMICSQLADRSAADGGWHVFQDNRWPGYVTPGALWGVRHVWGWRDETGAVRH